MYRNAEPNRKDGVKESPAVISGVGKRVNEGVDQSDSLGGRVCSEQEEVNPRAAKICWPATVAGWAKSRMDYGGVGDGNRDVRR
jgi:hypothetical protein